MSNDSFDVTARVSLAALVLANVLVAVQALRWDWGYYQLFLVYWFEALIIGGYNVLRILVVGLFGDQPFGTRVARNLSASIGARILLTLLGTGFFILKFCGFALMTGFWLLMLPVYLDDTQRPPADLLLEGLRRAGDGTGLVIGILLVSQGISFLWNFLARREFATQSVFGLVFWPYLRMGLALAVVIGGLIVVKLNPQLASTTTLVVALMLLKTVADAWAHRREHRPASLPGAEPRIVRSQRV